MIPSYDRIEKLALAPKDRCGSGGKSRAAGLVDATAGAMNSATGSEDLERRAWDLNPRDFRLPVFKTGALGRYASPPWANLPVGSITIKIAVHSIIEIQGLDRGAHMEFVSDRKHMYRKDCNHSEDHRKISIEVDRIKDDKK